MRLIPLFFILLFTAHAQTPFTLSNLKDLSIVVEQKEPLDQAIVDSFKKTMQTTLSRLGINSKGYFNDVLTVMVSQNEVGKVRLVTLTLVIIGQVTREGQKESVFGITYMMKDTIEVEDLHADLNDSLEFLLSEFSDQYKEDNKE